MSYVSNIDPGLPLFLFNYSDRKLHEIFESTSSGRMNINPYGWTADGSGKTLYPAQVLDFLSMAMLIHDGNRIVGFWYLPWLFIHEGSN